MVSPQRLFEATYLTDCNFPGHCNFGRLPAIQRVYRTAAAEGHRQPAGQTPVTNHLEFTGTTEAVETVDIRVRVVGFLESVNFNEGQFVEKGQLLFTIDPI